MAQHNVHNVKSIQEFHKMKGLPAPQHPLISLFDYGTVECSSEVHHKHFVLTFTTFLLKEASARNTNTAKDITTLTMA